MEFIQFVILSIIQGVTEFLPISSSAHLILLPLLANWQDQGLTIDIAAHLGSLLAIVCYFRKELSKILYSGINVTLKQKIETVDERLFLYLIISSIPVLLFGFLLKDIVATYLREPLLIALTSILFGLLLWYADTSGKQFKKTEQLCLRDILIIGMAQVLALIPGTSRSGITMTAGLMLGLERTGAVKFSFLMSIPVIFTISAYEFLQLLSVKEHIDMGNFILTVVLSALSAFFTIHFFFKFIEKIGMLPFVIYRVLLGIVLFIIFI